jgi:putative acetyltransferase
MTDKIRPATPGDFDAICDIYLDVHRGYYRTLISEQNLADYDERYAGTEEKRGEFKKKILSELRRTVVIVENGKVVGYMTIADNKSKVRIKSLFISPAVQGGGLGGRLVEYAKRLGKPLSLSVLENNTNAIGFYKKYGFTVVGRSNSLYYGVRKLSLETGY